MRIDEQFPVFPRRQVFLKYLNTLTANDLNAEDTSWRHDLCPTISFSLGKASATLYVAECQDERDGISIADSYGETLVDETVTHDSLIARLTQIKKRLGV
ncbi:hypothetical protein [Polycladidibacter hongkongensis]|uniref:hypothetical protein n=1 Tax=Polycladidibacter hongkongensis TaxID=1647556 RepID=UPI00083076B5|nr:hypothetical protein [Pseudovibrio hongkongensis]